MPFIATAFFMWFMLSEGDLVVWYVDTPKRPESFLSGIYTHNKCYFMFFAGLRGFATTKTPYSDFDILCYNPAAFRLAVDAAL